MAEIAHGADAVDIIRATYCEECKTGYCDCCYVTDMIYDAIKDSGDVEEADE